MLQRLWVADLDPARRGPERARDEGRDRLPVLLGRARAASQAHVRDLAEALIALGHDVVGAGAGRRRRRRCRRTSCRPGARAGAVQRLGRAADLRAGVAPRGCAAGCATATSTCCTCTSRRRRACRCSRCWAAIGPDRRRRSTRRTERSRAMPAAYAIAADRAGEGQRADRGQRARPRRPSSSTSAATPSLIPNGVHVRAFAGADAARPAGRAPGGTLGFLGRIDEPRKGLRRAARGAAARSSRRAPDVAAARRRAGRRRRGARRPAARAARPRALPRARSATRTRRALLRSVDVYVAPEHRRRELRHRAARGDGGRGAGAGQRPRRVPAGARRRARAGALFRVGDAPTWPSTRSRCSATRPSAATLPRPRGAVVARYDWAVVAARGARGLRDGDLVRAARCARTRAARPSAGSPGCKDEP